MTTTKTKAISATFLPRLDNPDMLLCDLQATALQAARAGLRLYTNGQRWAMLPRPRPGWMLFAEALEDLKPLVNKIPAPTTATTEVLYLYARGDEFAKTPEEAMARIKSECFEPENAIIVACRPVGRIKLTPNFVPMEAAA